MAKRLHKQYRTVSSDQIQGEGSFVKFKNLSIQEVLEFTGGNNGKTDPKEAGKLGLELLNIMIVDWNWVDDNDEPLPIPAQNPGTIAGLPFQESTWLLNASGIKDLVDQKN